MRVLHVDTARGWRGGQNQVLQTARGMAERGHEVRLACHVAGVLAERASGAALRVHPLRFQGDLSPLAVVPLARLARRMRAELLLLHDPHALLPGLLAARASGARALAVRRVDFRLRGGLSRAKYRACDGVIAVSRAIRAVLEQDGLAAGRLRLVHEGVPDRPPLPGGKQVLRELGVPAGSLVVGNVAALVDHKDHATLLQAAELVLTAMPRAAFVILGDGPLRSELEADARSRGLQGRCLFAGFRSDLDRLIPAFDVFCLSSRMEGLGTSLLDAMCFGRPIVATAAGGIPDAVEDGVTGRLVPPRDADALADALLQLLGDETARSAYGIAGRRAFEGAFTADRMVEATLAACRGMT